jgi:nitrogen regulatory protein PII
MNFMVVLIVDNNDACPAVLNAWEASGVTGATILASTGLGRIKNASLRDDFPLIPSIHDLFIREEDNHRTLFSVVNSQKMVDKLINATQEILGDLNNPHTGFLFVLPVSQVIGWSRREKDNSNR